MSHGASTLSLCRLKLFLTTPAAKVAAEEVSEDSPKAEDEELDEELVDEEADVLDSDRRSLDHGLHHRLAPQPRDLVARGSHPLASTLPPRGPSASDAASVATCPPSAPTRPLPRRGRPVSLAWSLRSTLRGWSLGVASAPANDQTRCFW